MVHLENDIRMMGTKVIKKKNEYAIKIANFKKNTHFQLQYTLHNVHDWLEGKV